MILIVIKGGRGWSRWHARVVIIVTRTDCGRMRRSHYFVCVDMRMSWYFDVVLNKVAVARFGKPILLRMLSFNIRFQLKLLWHFNTTRKKNKSIKMSWFLFCEPNVWETQFFCFWTDFGFIQWFRLKLMIISSYNAYKPLWSVD